MRLLLIAACVLACTSVYAQFDDNYLSGTTQPTNTSAPQGATDFHALSFGLLRPLSSFNDTWSGLTVNNIATTNPAGAGDFVRLRLWYDVGSDDIFSPSVDTPIAQATSNSFPVTFGPFTGTQTIPAGSAAGYFVTIDVSGSAAVSAQFQFEVYTTNVTGTSFPVVSLGSGFEARGPVIGVTGSGGGGGNQIVVTTQPAGAQPATAFTTQPVVELRNSSNALLSSDNTTVVTVGITSGTGTAGATLGGTLMAQASGGVVTFTNLEIDFAGSGYTLDFTAASFAAATSNAFDVGTPQTPTQLVITTQPAGATPGNPFATQPVLEIRDAANALVSSASHFVAVSLNGGGGGTLSGTLIVQAVGGVATFTDLEVDQAGTGYSLTFSAVNLTSATSATFNVTSGGGSSSSGGGGGGGGGGCAVQHGAHWAWLLALGAVLLGTRFVRRRA